MPAPAATPAPRLRVVGSGRAGGSVAGALGAVGWRVLPFLGRADDLSGDPTDAGVIAARSGAFVSVARQGRTCMASMMELVASLRDSSTHSFGFVLNEH